MKAKIYFLIIFFYGFLLYAQDFSTKFYLKTKYGVKDSVELGYSGAATFGLDSQYGEFGYSTPVNSNRFGASIIINENNKALWEIINYHEITTFSKKQIVPFHQTAWIEQNAIGIMVPVDSLPITISWDNSQFVDVQRDYSLITDWPVGGWFDAGDGSVSFLKYLKDNSSVLVDDKTVNYIYTDGTNEYPMSVFYIAFGNSDNIKTAVKSVDEIQLSDLAIIKNGFIEIKQDANVTIKSICIYNTLGELLFQKFSNHTSKIKIGDFKKGVYVLYLRTDEGQFSYKIINK